MSERVEVLEIDLSEVQTEAQETGQTLKELRAEVKELRNTLENTEVGTDEFGKALTDLTKKQQELTNVTKSGVAAQKGSYNDLVNQMALLKSEWRATADEGKRAAIGSQISDINTKLKEMDASVGNYQRNVGNYRQELKQLKEDLLSLEEGTEEYSAALARAAEISQKMQDVNEFVAGSAQDLGDHMQNVVGVAAGMVGAFQTVQASLHLLGVESESIEKMIVTMQNLMAITQGLTAIEDAIDKYKRLNNTIKGLTVVQNLFNTSKTKGAAANTADAAASTADAVAKGTQTAATTAATKATWSFNAALAANPLGAILIAITAVVTGLIALTSWLGDAGDETEALADANDNLTRSLEDQNKEIDYNIQMMMAQGKTRKQALQASLADYKKQFEDTYDEYLKMHKKAAASGGGWFSGPVSEEEKAELDKAYQTYVGQVEKYNDIVREINVLNQQEITDNEQKENEERLRNAERYAQERIRIAEQEAKNIKQIAQDFFENKDDLAFEVGLFNLDEEEKEVERLKRAADKVDKDMRIKLNEAAKSYQELARIGKISQEKANAEIAVIQENYNQWRIIHNTQTEQEIAEIRRKYQKQTIDDIKNNLNEQTEQYKKYRDRALRNVLLVEDTARKAFERETENSFLYDKVIAEEAMLNVLKKTYEEQLAVIQAQDEKERNAVDSQIKSLEAKQASQGLLESEKILLEDLKDQYTQIGAEAIALEEKLNGVNKGLGEIDLEKTIAKLEGVKEQFSILKDTFSELNDIGGAFSSEWSGVFDSVIDGIDTTIASLKVLDNSSATTKEKLGAIFNIAAAGFQAVSSIMGALADEQDETTEKGFETQKKFQIAQATMTMFAGILSAWASAMALPAPLSWIMGGVMTAATATLGAIQIANIKKQKFDGGGGDGPAVVPSLTAVGAMNAPVISTTNVEGASTEGQTTDTRVYVLESDISSTQNNVKTTVAEATF